MNLITIFIGLVSLAVGSFLNVVIYRLPIMLKNQWQQECAEALGQATAGTKKPIFNLALPRSHCPVCKHTISFIYNIPIISYIFLLGRCRYCKTKIPLRYPLIEVTTYLLSLIAIIHFGITWQTASLLLLTWGLIALVFIDLEHLLLPDIITLPLLWLGLFINTFGLFTSPGNAIIGAIAGYLALYLIAWLFKLIRGMEGMGHGDFKLLALFGAWLGWQMLPFVVFIAALLGLFFGIISLWRKKASWQHPIPFGPYLAIAGWIAIIWGPHTFNLYMMIITR
ncbi:MAG: prepilin peptidase [Gammaproteobacteria bacterium]|nr:prepilin peptidase [Gammaproteobacteria bacterium]